MSSSSGGNPRRMSSSTEGKARRMSSTPEGSSGGNDTGAKVLAIIGANKFASRVRRKSLATRDRVLMVSNNATIIIMVLSLVLQLRREKAEALQRKREEAERKARRGEIDPTHEFTFLLVGQVCNDSR